MRQTGRRNLKRFFVFMVVLGLSGLLLSWFTLGPQYLLLIPGLSATATGETVAVQHIEALDGPYEYERATIRFTDDAGQLHTIQWSGIVSGTIRVRYLRARPDFAIAETNWLDNLLVVLQLPCIDLPCLLAIVLGIFFYRKHGRQTEMLK